MKFLSRSRMKYKLFFNSLFGLTSFTLLNSYQFFQQMNLEVKFYVEITLNKDFQLSLVKKGAGKKLARVHPFHVGMHDVVIYLSLIRMLPGWWLNKKSDWFLNLILTVFFQIWNRAFWITRPFSSAFIDWIIIIKSVMQIFFKKIHRLPVRNMQNPHK